MVYTCKAVTELLGFCLIKTTIHPINVKKNISAHFVLLNFSTQ